ncbi:MAG: ATP-dependent sacrificial sulfur transferase LarE [Methanomicrobiales archaeon]|nr:ATP-dependent sacrificial sulfur transferase LarE [Methanomicrobiales archaeon]
MPVACVADRLSSAAPVVIAVSGGTDSLLLLAIAAANGIPAAAVTVDTGMNPPGECRRAERIAHRLSIPFHVLAVDMLALPAVAGNADDRCYRCKYRMMEAIAAWATAHGYATVVDGTHADDAAGTRPGMRALAELGIASPFKECGIGKEEIRSMAGDFGIPIVPSSSCLATRFPAGTPVSRDGLERVRRAERLLRRRVRGHLRVRVSGDRATVECEAGECSRASGMIGELLGLGFASVTIEPKVNR